ncbi:hypothetical protein HG66A1_34560 [Gimesia chilikensis]|uniref:Uncharacterized protein n=1 Tax=Gimesia chilikensis TaxID=2605989 RepID=A0A517PQJ3_9PLAN|nr:hypothetical protein HG66A1_34560 [Gimesia chilikensis]
MAPGYWTDYSLCPFLFRNMRKKRDLRQIVFLHSPFPPNKIRVCKIVHTVKIACGTSKKP